MSAHLLDARHVAAALGGDVVGRDAVSAPGPGHSHKDRSLSVKLDPSAPDGFVVYSHSGDDPIECRDYVRRKLGLSEWKPRSKGDDYIRKMQERAARGSRERMTAATPEEARTTPQTFPAFTPPGETASPGSVNGRRPRFVRMRSGDMNTTVAMRSSWST